MIACVAIVGPKNNPLLIHPLEETSSNPLKFDYVVYVCLDAIDSVILEQADKAKSETTKSQASSTNGQAPVDRRFLGLVSVTPEFHVYAEISLPNVEQGRGERTRHLTTNQTKILVLVSSVAKQASTPRFNADIAQLLLRVEKAYKHAVSNPFYTPGTMLTSERFKNEVTSLVKVAFDSSTMPQTGLAASALG